MNLASLLNLTCVRNAQASKGNPAVQQVIDSAACLYHRLFSVERFSEYDPYPHFILCRSGKFGAFIKQSRHYVGE
jgi:hypothetical protein